MKEFTPIFSHWNIAGQNHLSVEWKNQHNDTLYFVHSLDGNIRHQNTGRSDAACQRYLSKYMKKYFQK